MRERLLLFFGCLLLPTLSFAQNVVVWDFATRDGRKTDTTASLTYEFEEALAQDRTYTVLERRNLARLQAVIENEKALKDIGQISPAGSSALKKLGVSVVAFGEMFDDVDSGDVSITVTFQEFTGKKLLIKSVLMRRGLLRDATSRRERMSALVQAITGATARLPQATPQPVTSAKEQGFSFDVVGCRDEGSSIRCDVVVTNQRADRWIWMSSGRDHGTYIVDTAGNRCSAGDSTFTWGTLAEGVPMRMTFEFQRCPRNVTHLAYLEVGFKLGNPAFPTKFKVPFRGIPVTP